MNAAIYDSRELTSYTRVNTGTRICKMVARSSALTRRCVAPIDIPFAIYMYFYGGTCLHIVLQATLDATGVFIEVRLKDRFILRIQLSNVQFIKVFLVK